MKNKKELGEDKTEPEKPKGNRDKTEMHFIDHLEEFRWVMIRSVVAFLTGCILIGVFLTFTAGFLAYPLEIATAKFGTEMGALVTISPMGAFTVLIQVCFLGGTALSLPFILYFFAGFLAPGLTVRERRVLFPGCVLGIVLFVMGTAFAYYFILPLSILVSLQFNQLLGLRIVWSASEYYNFVVWTILAVGGSFEFPLVLLLLQYVEIVTPATLRRVRSMVVVATLAISAIMTPSDPLSMLVMAFPLYGLYEMSILMGDIVLRKKRIAKEQAEAESE
jgi:sec-independent protein translocase protein TatC